MLGGPPCEEARPTAEQLSGLHARMAAGKAPYTDFAVWGADGRRQTADGRRQRYFPLSLPIKLLLMLLVLLLTPWVRSFTFTGLLDRARGACGDAARGDEDGADMGSPCLGTSRVDSRSRSRVYPVSACRARRAAPGSPCAGPDQLVLVPEGWLCMLWCGVLCCIC